MTSPVAHGVRATVIRVLGALRHPKIRFLRAVHLRYQVFAASLLMVFLVATAIGIGFLGFYRSTEIDQAISYSTSLAEQSARTIATTARNVRRYVDTNIRLFEESHRGSVPSTEIDEHLRLPRWRGFAIRLVQSDAIVDRVIVWAGDSPVYAYDTVAGHLELAAVSSVTDYVQRHEAYIRDRWGDPVWFAVPGDDAMVYMVRSVYSYEGPRFTGFVVAGVPISFFADQFKWYRAVGGGTLSVYNALLEDVYVPGHAPTADTSSSAFSSDTSPRNDWIQTVKTDHALHVYARPGGQHLTTVTVVGFEELLSGVSAIRSIVITVSIVAVLLALFLAWVVAGSVTHDIADFSRTIADVDAMSLSVRLDVHGSDEVAQLRHSFNRMMSRLERTVHELAIARSERHEAELRVLQAEHEALLSKVNPHFLYNVLESINGLAKLDGDRNVSAAIIALSRLLRTAVNGEQSAISLTQEVRYVQDYVYLQRLVTGGNVDACFDVEPELSNLEVPRLFLQPLVENSIQCATREHQTDLIVSVTARRRDETVEICVSDNGSGFTEEALQRVRALQQATAVEERKSGGLIGVVRRLRLHYGAAARVTVLNDQNRGAVVHIELPVCSGDELLCTE